MQALAHVRCRYAFQLVGYVVMPEHVHLLISEPQKGDPSKVLQVLKQTFSRSVRRRRKKSSSAQLCLPLAPAAEDNRPFWQRRFYDFNVWSMKKVREKLDYMHATPSLENWLAIRKTGLEQLVALRSR